jgi:hypothetical protein
MTGARRCLELVDEVHRKSLQFIAERGSVGSACSLPFLRLVDGAVGLHHSRQKQAYALEKLTPRSSRSRHISVLSASALPGKGSYTSTALDLRQEYRQYRPGDAQVFSLTKSETLLT